MNVADLLHATLTIGDMEASARDLKASASVLMAAADRQLENCRLLRETLRQEAEDELPTIDAADVVRHYEQPVGFRRPTEMP